MEQKTKFIIIGLAGLCIVFLFLFFQATNSQQRLLRESNDLKAENTSLLNKSNKLENDLKELQNKMGPLKAEKDKVQDELVSLQQKFEAVSKDREGLIEKLKQMSKAQVSIVTPPVEQTPAPVVVQTDDAYWGQVLKEKTKLEMQLTDIRTELKNLQISNETLQREKSALEFDLNTLRNDRAYLLRELDYNKKLLDSISQEVVREKNDKEGIRENLKTLRAQNVALSTQLKTLISRKEALDKKVQILQDERVITQKRLSEMEQMLTDNVSKVDTLKKALEVTRGGNVAGADKTGKDAVELPAIVVHSSPDGQKDSIAIKEYPGKILAVNLDSNFVVIDLGSSSGVKAGDTFGVFRDAREIGAISVIQVRSGISACDIRRMSVPIKIGDGVK